MLGLIFLLASFECIAHESALAATISSDLDGDSKAESLELEPRRTRGASPPDEIGIAHYNEQQLFFIYENNDYANLPVLSRSQISMPCHGLR
jgi:hypothetical protein